MKGDVVSDGIPGAFWLRRIHSLAGFALTGYIVFHLFTNMQAALWIGGDGQGFIRSVNAIHEIPFLKVVEVLVIALPLAIHALVGFKILQTGKSNSYGYDGKSPYLPEYGRNRAYTWQRITSWLLLAGIAFHVIQMRFVDAPVKTGDAQYEVLITQDPGIATVASRLGVVLMEKEGRLAAVAKDFGTAELLMVRETFKSPLMILIYTILVLAACFHAFNGLWTFMITWGVVLSESAQRMMLKGTTFLMFLVTFFGLATIYLTYWVNLRN
jgi:succinate dehydrogenase / fumarate reductase, cytochrome b subunit